MFGLGKKKKEEAPATGAPVEQVNSMRQQGYNNDQIIQALQGQGYNSSQIFEALNQASASAGFQQMPAFDSAEQAFAQQPLEQPPEPIVEPQQPSERIEEVAEAIIDEKWNEFAKDMNKVVEWKDRTESRLVRIEQEIKHIKESFDLLHKSVLGKISEYDKNITEVSTGINAMERVFQKILPTLTENVNKLSRITEGAKKK